jgi:hypothetical protein
VATAVISEAVHSGSAAVSEDAPRRVMPSAAVSGTLGRGILVVARSSVSGTLGRGISAVVISFSSTSRDYNFLSINSRDASRFTLLRQMGDALLQGSSQIMRWETRHWKARLRSSDGRRAFGRNVSDHEDGRRATARLVSDHGRLAFVPTSDKTRLGVWRSEQAIRTCSLILWWCGWVDLGKVVLADVRLGGSAAAGGGDLVGSVSRRAAGARSSLFLLSCVAGAVAR